MTQMNLPSNPPSSPPGSLLEMLWRELEFLRSGGYRREDTTWRPRWIFLDSPTCRRGSAGAEGSCAGCPLLEIAPTRAQWRIYPCHAIAVEAHGRTLGELQQEGDIRKLEAALETWLVSEIQRRIEAAPKHLPASVGRPAAEAVPLPGVRPAAAGR